MQSAAAAAFSPRYRTGPSRRRTGRSRVRRRRRRRRSQLQRLAGHRDDGVLVRVEPAVVVPCRGSCRSTSRRRPWTCRTRGRSFVTRCCSRSRTSRRGRRRRGSPRRDDDVVVPALRRAVADVLRRRHVGEHRRTGGVVGAVEPRAFGPCGRRCRRTSASFHAGSLLSANSARSCCCAGFSAVLICVHVAPLSERAPHALRERRTGRARSGCSGRRATSVVRADVGRTPDQRERAPRLPVDAADGAAGRVSGSRPRRRSTELTPRIALARPTSRLPVPVERDARDRAVAEECRCRERATTCRRRRSTCRCPTPASESPDAFGSPVPA